VQKPRWAKYPKILKCIGDHIRKWRISNDFLQKDVAQILSVSIDTITGWEIGETTPAIRHMPKIIQMLGYFPLKIDCSTLGGRITYLRYLRGLTPKEFGRLFGADPSTVRAWESNKNTPQKNRKKEIERIIY